MNIYDISQKANVSIATVSRVINGSKAVNEQTRQKVLNIINELDYSPNVYARGLMGNPMKIIGIMTIDVCDLYFANAIYIIEQKMRENGYDALLCNTSDSLKEKKKYLKLLLQKRVAGLILVGSVFKEKKDNSHIIEAAKQVPVVMMNGYVDGENIYSVLCDESLAIRNAVNFLADKGHKKIAYIYDVDTYSSSQKLAGFKAAMSARASKNFEHGIIKTAKGLQGGYDAITKLLAKKIRFSAVITSEDLLAVGVLKKIKEIGKKVPDDIAVIGFNNSLIAECTEPGLTSLDNKVQILSSQAVKLLLDTLDGKSIPAKTIIPPELVLRNTA